MSTLIFRRNTCRLCGSREIELVLKLEPTPPGDAYVSVDRLDDVQIVYPIDLFLCNSCGLAQLLDVIDAEVLYSDFTYFTSNSIGLTEHFQRYADEVFSHVKPSPRSLVVDIGSNDGSLLAFFQSRGLRILGVEPAHRIAQRATASGIETLPSFFTADFSRKIYSKYGPAMIITANNVLANVDNLIDFIDGIRNLLDPEGVFVFETGYLVDLVQQTLVDTIYHEHLSYFSARSLEFFFRHYGMELIDIKRVPTKGGSLRGIVQLTGGPHAPLPSVSELIKFETSRGIERAALKELSAQVNTIKSQLVTLLHDLKSQGKIIVGYGASVGVTTLTYYFGLGDLLSYFVDDNLLKHNLYSPGKHIPVLPSQVIYNRKPDFVIILAWRYAEVIMKKHQAYLAQGGHFIIPLPKIKVV